ncbi:unnamed protein product [Thelazia callipaeda]|uniref:Ovule protein n=1 Tax=Thelazia callipaeda TaxID=103827 RepID=A0A0N5CJ46_THECL|nr:unnamed protein product [Thelazia callipaeda]
MPDVYAHFVQGGNNLKSLYATSIEDSDQKINWNLLFAIIYSVLSPAKSGAGDKQNVVSCFNFSSCRKVDFRSMLSTFIT